MMDYEWIDCGDGRSVLRKVRQPVSIARSTLPCPSVRSDYIDPVKSPTDGKSYSSLSALRESYRQGGYVEVGNSDLSDFKPPTRDRKADRAAIERAISDVEYGRAPPVLSSLPESP